jgi:hypothetical protein
MKYALDMGICFLCPAIFCKPDLRHDAENQNSLILFARGGIKKQ